MGDENIFDKIQEILGHMPSALSILEEQIDIDLQMEYFEHSRKVSGHLCSEDVIRQKEDVFTKEIPISNKKDLLVRLAGVDDVEAFRTIEKYLREPDPEIRDWALLALQESRMLLESKLLDQNQVFISTGLGGKGHKLRYFVALLPRSGDALSDLQERVLRNETAFFLGKVNAEIEELEFHPAYVKLMVVIPLQITIKELFDRIISECNEYGDFLQNHFIVTNVKKLSNEEVLNFLSSRQENATGEE